MTYIANNYNYIINGAFDYWQRGLITTALTGQVFLADRFATNSTGTTVTQSRQSFTVGQIDVPGNQKYFSRLLVTSVAATSNFATYAQKIESVMMLAGKYITLSFYAKADTPKNIFVEFNQNFGSGGSTQVNTQGGTIALTTSWTKYVITKFIPSIASKIIGTNDYLGITFWFDAGSDFAVRTNSLGQQNGQYDIANVKLEEGCFVTEFVRQDIDLSNELIKCMRYFETSSPRDFYSNFNSAMGYNGFRMPFAIGSGDYILGSNSFKVVKRSTPVVNLYTYNSLTTTSPGYISVAGASRAASAIDISAGGFRRIYNTSGATWYTAEYVDYNFTADAEI